MRLILLALAAVMTLGAADAPARNPLEIPKKAVETEPGFYRYKDKQGKTWMYRKTPFGVMRWEDQPADQAAEAAARAKTIAYMHAAEDGDTVRFVRETPFGPHRWERRKAEMDDVERAVWERDCARAVAQRD